MANVSTVSSLSTLELVHIVWRWRGLNWTQLVLLWWIYQLRLVATHAGEFPDFDELFTMICKKTKLMSRKYIRSCIDQCVARLVKKTLQNDQRKLTVHVWSSFPLWIHSWSILDPSIRMEVRTRLSFWLWCQGSLMSPLYWRRESVQRKGYASALCSVVSQFGAVQLDVQACWTVGNMCTMFHPKSSLRNYVCTPGSFL